ncbi:small ribosomal subunit protein uS2m isoform X2 [Centruroides vittatus]|uniref:small ribosomal subunit protein uS2m isoform X2 n=1 Tax=Centruroides vittatus TaxID=120091 RepID=UPI00350F38DC
MAAFSSMLATSRLFRYFRNIRLPNARSSTLSAKTVLVQVSSQDESRDKETIVFNPLDHPDFFNVKAMINVKELFDAKVHLGHKEGTLNEHMKPYIFGSRLGHLIIDLDQTVEHLQKALNFLSHIVYQDGLVLFVTRHRQTAYLVEKTAMECNEFSYTKNWYTGVFTNSTKMFSNVTRLPDVVVFLNTLNNVLETHTCVHECAKMLIPSIGIVDTNCSPNLITYPIPGNDDTPSAIELYCKLFKMAILNAKQKRREIIEKFKTNAE